MLPPNDEIISYLDKTGQVIVITPILWVKHLTGKDPIIKKILSAFHLSICEPRVLEELRLVVSNQKPGNHKLDAITLFTAAIAIVKSSSIARTGLMVQNILESSIRSGNNLPNTLHSIINTQASITLSEEIRTYLHSCGLPVLPTGTGALTESEFKDCSDFLATYNQRKLAV